MRRLLWLFFSAVVYVVAQSQPIPFSHKTHTSVAKLVCADCHPVPAKFGVQMGFPAASKCMVCHVAVATERPAIVKLAGFAKSNGPIPWQRVYRLPDFVFFDHRYHLMNDAKCADCHGAVENQDVIADEANATKMVFCQSCHVKMKANNGCVACHNRR